MIRINYERNVVFHCVSVVQRIPQNICAAVFAHRVITHFGVCGVDNISQTQPNTELMSNEGKKLLIFIKLDGTNFLSLSHWLLSTCASDTLILVSSNYWKIEFSSFAFSVLIWNQSSEWQHNFTEFMSQFSEISLRWAFGIDSKWISNCRLNGVNWMHFH